MCTSIIADSFLAKLGRLTEYLPGISEVVDLVMEVAVPKSVAAAACSINQPISSGTGSCVYGTPYGGDNLVWCCPCPPYNCGYQCFYYKAVYSGGWKYRTGTSKGCSSIRSSSCPSCYSASNFCTSPC